MKQLLIAGVIAFLGINIALEIPVSKAPEEDQRKLFQASIVSHEHQSETQEISSNETIRNSFRVILKANHHQTKTHLHALAADDQNPSTKKTAQQLLQIYQTFEKHRDLNESYLWILFAQKASELEEWTYVLELTDKALEQAPTYRDAWLLKGYASFQLRDLQAAEASLTKAHEQDPSNAQIQYLLGLTYFEQDPTPKKTELSNKYLLYAKQNGSPYLSIIFEKLAENAIRSEDYALANHYYQQALDIKPTDKSILSRLIWLTTEHLQQLNVAEDYAIRLTLKYPKDSNSFHLRSWVASKKGDLEDAMKYLEQAKQLEH